MDKDFLGQPVVFEGIFEDQLKRKYRNEGLVQLIGRI